MHQRYVSLYQNVLLCCLGFGIAKAHRMTTWEWQEISVGLWNVALTKPSLEVFWSCTEVLGILNYQGSLAAFCTVFGCFFQCQVIWINLHLRLLLPSFGPMGSVMDN